LFPPAPANTIPLFPPASSPPLIRTAFIPIHTFSPMHIFTTTPSPSPTPTPTSTPILTFTPTFTPTSTHKYIDYNYSRPSYHYCYLLQSIPNPRRTYVGYTVDPKRRLRQHNGEIKGGAKKTRKGRPWRMICYIGGFPDERTALQFEYANHHPKCKGSGLGWRLRNMERFLRDGGWTRTSPPIHTLSLTLNWLVDGYTIPEIGKHCQVLTTLALDTAKF
jgi:predicted GIY-YIG superfamily endonuclease